MRRLAATVLRQRRARLGVVRVGGRIEALGYWVRLPADVLARNGEIRKVMVHPEARGLGLSRR